MTRSLISFEDDRRLRSVRFILAIGTRELYKDILQTPQYNQVLFILGRDCEIPDELNFTVR